MHAWRLHEMEGIDYGKTDRKPNELGLVVLGDVRCERGQMSRLQSCADKHLTIGKQIAELRCWNTAIRKGY